MNGLFWLLEDITDSAQLLFFLGVNAECEVTEELAPMIICME